MYNQNWQTEIHNWKHQNKLDVVLSRQESVCSGKKKNHLNPSKKLQTDLADGNAQLKTTVNTAGDSLTGKGWF